MSQENVEIVRRLLEAFNSEDYEGCFELIDPGVEWHPPPDIPNAAVARGHDALAENMRDWLGAWDDYRMTPEEVLEGDGDTVLVIALESGRGKDSGIEVQSRRIIQVYELRDGRIARFKAYLDRAAALEAAGLSG